MMRTRIAAPVCAIAVLLLTLLAFRDPRLVLQGWLAALVWASMVPVGAVTLLLTHRITGGEWGFALAPVLEPAARAIAGVALIALPVLLFPHAIYRWQTAPEYPRTISSHYLTSPLFGLRTVIAFAVWSGYAWIPALRRSKAGAAVGLIILAIVTNVIPVDWVISTQPGYHSSSFGFGFWIEQMLAALGLCALTGAEGDETRNCRDLAGLVISLLLGTIYFVYVEFAVIWYGNIPDKTAWFIIRGYAPWPEIGGLALFAGAVAPFLALLNDKVRQSELWLKVIGGAVSVAIALHVIWLVIPSFGPSALAPGFVALLAVATASGIWIMRFTGYWRLPWTDVAVDADEHV